MTTLFTNKTVTLPFQIRVTSGHTSRQSRNGRWVPHRECLHVGGYIGQQCVASFSYEFVRLKDEDYEDWIGIECESFMRTLAGFGVQCPQIISADEMAKDLKALLLLEASKQPQAA